jgi:hypothetical protein
VGNSISIGDLAAILTVAGVSIYVLGLMGLAATIRLSLVSNISLAWYAVSLLPRTVVAGHGVRVWLILPMGLTIVLSIAAFWVGTRSTWESVTFAENYLSGGVFIVVIITTLVVFYRRSSKQTGLRLLDTFGVLLATTWITALLGGWVMMIAAQLISEGFFDALDAQRSSPANSQVVPGLLIPPVTSGMVLGIMFIFVGGFFVGMPIALTVEPPLPPVEVTRKNAQGSARGRLVNHSEGFWHLFVESDSDRRKVPTKCLTSSCPSPTRRCWPYESLGRRIHPLRNNLSPRKLRSSRASRRLMNPLRARPDADRGDHTNV